MATCPFIIDYGGMKIKGKHEAYIMSERGKTVNKAKVGMIRRVSVATSVGDHRKGNDQRLEWQWQPWCPFKASQSLGEANGAMEIAPKSKHEVG